ncbi:hypothetical protein GW17_00013010 [Ensete ventricosum]|nr:hypothetical protein GW17_00013010 [Ensete ventricosum]
MRDKTKVRHTGLYWRTKIWLVWYGSVTVDFDHYRVCSSYRPVQGGPRTEAAAIERNVGDRITSEIRIEKLRARGGKLISVH